MHNRYNANVPSPMNLARVSSRGQTNLPAELRHRWGIAGGGDIAFVDLGDAALVLPGGISQARVELKNVIARRYDAGLDALNDPDLADQ